MGIHIHDAPHSAWLMAPLGDADLLTGEDFALPPASRDSIFFSSTIINGRKITHIFHKYA